MYTEQTKENLAVINQALEWMNTDISKDHYEGEYSLYRLTGYVSLNRFVPNFYESPEFKYTLDYLSSLPVRPARVFVSCDGSISIDWFANDVQVVSSKSQYIQLIMEFQMFLRDYSSPFFTLEIQEGFFSDDPNERITSFPVEELNLNPKFNAECFGSNEEIEVIKW